MYLSKLQIHGFKSFAEPTSFHFDPGITAIVGPNGCGKSNVVDALRWVVGEQRARVLRSGRMEGVIFNGTSRRKGLGMAEVMLTIQNSRGVLPTEYSEVTLGRRLFRSGESEYLLNGTPCRLRDIVDLFLDTGMGAGAYSVIELKMVEDILSERAQDRRRLFEEAAGVTRYKLRRTQALKKLDGLQYDLTRIQDLIEELSGRLRRLKRQARAAARHKALTERANALQRTLAAWEHRRLATEVAAIEAQRVRASTLRTQLMAECGSREAALAALRKSVIHEEQTMVDADRCLATHQERTTQLEGELRLNAERHATASRDLERAQRGRAHAHVQINKADEARAQLLKEQTRLQVQHREASQALAKALGARDAARQAFSEVRIRLGERLKTQTALAGTRAAHERQLERLSSRAALAKQEQIRHSADAAKLQHAIADAKTGKAVATTARIAALAALDEAKTAANEAASAHDALQTRIDEATRKVAEHARKEAATDAEASLLDALIGSYEDFPESTRFLARANKRLRTVSDVLTIDGNLHRALGAALGELASCIIVQTAKEAQDAVARLRNNKKGCALFAILDRLPATVPPHTERSKEKPLADLVTVTDKAYEPLARLLLRDIFLAPAEDVSDCSSLPVSGRLVTADGQWVDERGLLLAGSESIGASAQQLDRRARLAAARESLTDTRASKHEVEQVLNVLRARQQALSLPTRREKVIASRHAFAAAAAEESRRTGVLNALVKEQKDLQERITNATKGVKTRASAFAAAEGQVLRASNKLQTLKDAIAQDQEALAATEADSQHMEDHYAAARVAHQSAAGDLDQVRRDLGRTAADHDESVARAKALAEKEARIATSLDALGKATETLKADLVTERERRPALEEAVRRAKTALMENRVQADRLEKILRKLRRAGDEAAHEERAHAVQQATLNTRLEEVAASVHIEGGEEIDAHSFPEGSNEQTLKAELQSVRNKLGNLGAINAMALEEYESEKIRHDFVRRQWDDLKESESTLLKTTEEINRAAARQFRATFTAIRAHFRKLFVELFGLSTTADISLADDRDPLESPIVITACPHGKRPISIAQLSSGEKALTAIALLFAIYKVKPSPFCFLDEVDAPLDESNVYRFMHLVRQFTNDTQFVLVTHNQRTMEMADRLYGITMQEAGVSQLVGIRFDEAIALATAD